MTLPRQYDLCACGSPKRKTAIQCWACRHGVGRARPVEERFWAKVDVRGPDECWPWVGALTSGYGSFWDGKRRVKAPRYSWELNVAPIPDGMLICHRCDNPRCVNPAHLFVGTVADNTHDMMAKGRKAVAPSLGEAHGMARLKEADVREIRRLAASVSRRELAERFGVTSGMIWSIITRRAWRHIP